MSDNRTRKQDRKQIKLLQKSIRRLEESAQQERQGSPRHVSLMDEASELRVKMARIQQSMERSAEWDDREPEDYDRIYQDQARKNRRARKQESFDDNSWA